MNNNAFRNLSYGVYIISTWDNGRPTGCTANSAMQITSEPATIAISINHNNYTNKCIEESGKFAMSIIGENCEPSIIGTFGFQSGKDVNKFDAVKHEVKGNMPIVKDACSYITCEVINKMETDTHTVFLGKVIDADILSKDDPMTYAYYHKVIKGKSPKNAPTYIPEDDELDDKKESYAPIKREASPQYGTFQCSVCGYVYDGDIPFEELPEYYTCPMCKQPKKAFKKQA